MRAFHAQSPDGRQWRVRVSRFRPPRWRASDYEPEEHDPFWLVLEYAYAVVVWFVIPLFVAILELPLSFVRGLFSSRRWIEAASDDLSPIRILWSADQSDVERLAAEIARRLGQGYDEVTPAGAELVEMSEPPGMRDLT